MILILSDSFLLMGLTVLFKSLCLLIPYGILISSMDRQLNMKLLSASRLATLCGSMDPILLVKSMTVNCLKANFFLSFAMTKLSKLIMDIKGSQAVRLLKLDIHVGGESRKLMSGLLVHIGPFMIGVSFGGFARLQGFFFPVDFLPGLYGDSPRTLKNTPSQARILKERKPNRSIPQADYGRSHKLDYSNQCCCYCIVSATTRFLRGAELLFFLCCWD